MNQWEDSQISTWENEGGASRFPPVEYDGGDVNDLVLLHLGRNVVVYWNELSQRLQRLIFHTEKSDVALAENGRLGELTAKYLHAHSGGRDLANVEPRLGVLRDELM